MEQMISKLAVIEEVLNNKFKAKNQKALVEEDIDSKGKSFEVHYDIIHENISYSLYRYNPNESDIFPYFSHVSGLKKICDYVIFAEEANYLYVFLIELKKSNLSARKQLVASKTFIEYIISSARRIGKDIDDNVAIRMIRICDNKVAQKRGRREEDVIVFDQDEYCDYLYKNFRLKILMHY